LAASRRRAGRRQRPRAVHLRSRCPCQRQRLHQGTGMGTGRLKKAGCQR
jgi:hypothetical protein